MFESELMRSLQIFESEYTLNLHDLHIEDSTSRSIIRADLEKDLKTIVSIEIAVSRFETIDGNDTVVNSCFQIIDLGKRFLNDELTNQDLENIKDNDSFMEFGHNFAEDLEIILYQFKFGKDKDKFKEVFSDLELY